jgi:hypothetical protein
MILVIRPYSLKRSLDIVIGTFTAFTSRQYAFNQNGVIAGQMKSKFRLAAEERRELDKKNKDKK